MVRKKLTSNKRKHVIEENKKVSEVIKDLSESSATIHNSTSSGKKNKLRDIDDILSHFEDSVHSFQEGVLESAEFSEEEEEKEEQAPVQAKKRNNQSAVKKKTKSYWELNALKQIRKYQKDPGLLVPRAPFARLCKDIFFQYCPSNFRVAKAALECLQEATEMYLVQLFEDSYLCSQHCNRKTLMARDMRLARRIGGRDNRYL